MISEKGMKVDFTNDEIDVLRKAFDILEGIKKNAKQNNKKYIYTLNDEMFACELFDIMETTYTIYALINDEV